MSTEDDVFAGEERPEFDPAEFEADESQSDSDLREQLDAERQERERLEAEFEQFKREMVAKVNELQAAVDGQSVVGDTELQQYATAPDDIRAGLSTNKERAVRLYENWHEIAWKQQEAHGGRYFIDTKTPSMKKNHPSKLRHELETRWDENLHSPDIYRTMKQLAKMSGSEESVDEYGRVHITGGEYEYHERPTADNKSIRRLVVEVGQHE